MTLNRLVAHGVARTAVGGVTASAVRQPAIAPATTGLFDQLLAQNAWTYYGLLYDLQLANGLTARLGCDRVARSGGRLHAGAAWRRAIVSRDNGMLDAMAFHAHRQAAMVSMQVLQSTDYACAHRARSGNLGYWVRSHALGRRPAVVKAHSSQESRAAGTLTFG